MTKYSILQQAVEITKEYVRGSGSLHPDQALERIYMKLKDLYTETEEKQ